MVQIESAALRVPAESAALGRVRFLDRLSGALLVAPDAQGASGGVAGRCHGRHRRENCLLWVYQCDQAIAGCGVGRRLESERYDGCFEPAARIAPQEAQLVERLVGRVLTHRVQRVEWCLWGQAEGVVLRERGRVFGGVLRCLAMCGVSGRVRDTQDGGTDRYMVSS